MKARIIVFNWLLSFTGLCIDMERSPSWAVVAAVSWFAVSTLLLRLADPYKIFRDGDGKHRDDRDI
jgi:hypothetical protein